MDCAEDLDEEGLLELADDLMEYLLVSSWACLPDLVCEGILGCGRIRDVK